MSQTSTQPFNWRLPLSLVAVHSSGVVSLSFVSWTMIICKSHTDTNTTHTHAHTHTHTHTHMYTHTHTRTHTYVHSHTHTHTHTPTYIHTYHNMCRSDSVPEIEPWGCTALKKSSTKTTISQPTNQSSLLFSLFLFYRMYHSHGVCTGCK